MVHIPGVNPRLVGGGRGFWAVGLMAGVGRWAPGAALHWRTLALLNDLTHELATRVFKVRGGGGGVNVLWVWGTPLN